MKIRKDDEVIVIAGSSRGLRGRVFQIFPSKNRVLIRGVNLLKKTLKKSKEHPNGAIIDRELPVHISNVLLYCPKNDKGVRTTYVIDDKGVKRRKAKGVEYVFDN